MTYELAISTRAQAIEPSATLAVSARAGQLKAQGKHVLNFSAGEPDFKPPTAVRTATAAFVAEAAMPYSPVPGVPALRTAVARELSSFHGREFSADEVLISCGAKHSLANLFLATLNPGDEVVMFAPYWVSYPDMVRLAEGTPIAVPTAGIHGWRPQPAALAKVLGPKTKFVLVNSPSNPTGAGLSPDDLLALAHIVVERAPQAYLLFDDIYRSLVYDDYQAPSAYRTLAGVTDQIVIVDGVSKTYAMTGYRIGFLAASKPVIGGASRIQSQMTSGAATVAQHAALTALTHPSVAEEVGAMRTAFAGRRLLMMEGLAVAPGIEFTRPQGAFYLFVDVRHHTGRRFADDVALAQWLLEEKLVATVPGTPFGAPGYLRFSYATDEATIAEGCSRIVDALRSIA
jgi:aspartate aminotransferase